jgi:hypothetical protein
VPETTRAGSKLNNLSPFLVIGAGCVVFILLAIGIVAGFVFALNLPVFFSNVPASVDAVPRVSLADAKQAYDNGAAIFVDVRTVDAYQAGHVKSALSIPESEIYARINELDKKAWIIPYCT